MYKRKKKNQFSSFVPKDHVTKYIPHAYQVQTYSGEIRLDFSTMIHFCSRWPSFLLILANESICGIFFSGTINKIILRWVSEKPSLIKNIRDALGRERPRSTQPTNE